MMRAKAREAETLPLPTGIELVGPCHDLGSGYNAKLHETYLAVSKSGRPSLWAGGSLRTWICCSRLALPGPLSSFGTSYPVLAEGGRGLHPGICHLLRTVATTCVISGISVAEQAVRPPAESAPPLSKAA